jgi:hypothetical protein
MRHLQHTVGQGQHVVDVASFTAMQRLGPLPVPHLASHA